MTQGTKLSFGRKLPFGARIAVLALMVLVNFKIVTAIRASAQPPQKTGAPPPSFEVASIKPSNLRRGGVIGLFVFPGGRITATLYTFKMLMMSAFEVQPFQILGGPSWINDTRYDIIALPPPSSAARKLHPPSPKTPPNAEERAMLQNLLMDRFQLKFHWESKVGPVYILETGKKSLNLRPAEHKTDYPWAGSISRGGIDGDGLAGDNISMPQLAARLSPYLDRPVLDETGLKGSYDFSYRYSSNPSRSDIDSCIFTSIREIGLKLKAGKGPVRTIVIDHVEPPTPN